MREVRVFAPATVSNIGCGYDVFGMALKGPGDVVSARFAEGKGVVSVSVSGDGGRVPADPARNCAAVAAQAVMDRLPGGRGTAPTSAPPGAPRVGVALEVRKGLPLASGLGGSAASAVAGAVAADALLGGGLDRTALLECAMTGERHGSGATHADNVAPALAGGFVLVPPGEPLRIVQLPTPAELVAAVVRPHMEVETAKARALLGDAIALSAGIRQWGNAAGLVAGLYAEDWELLGRCIEDAVAEPARAQLVPGFEEAKRRALEAGAVGAGLSGSGPSVFAFCRGRSAARSAAGAMADAFRDEAGVDADVIVSPPSPVGARVLGTAARSGAPSGAAQTAGDASAELPPAGAASAGAPPASAGAVAGG